MVIKCHTGEAYSPHGLGHDRYQGHRLNPPTAASTDNIGYLLSLVGLAIHLAVLTKMVIWHIQQMSQII